MPEVKIYYCLTCKQILSEEDLEALKDWDIDLNGANCFDCWSALPGENPCAK